jgi:inosine/xanthosine triphosphatase
MLIAVGSRNPVKIAATSAGFTAVWPNTAWQVEGVDVPSGVSDQPMSHAESIRGARNRAMLARKRLDAAFGAGIESGLEQIEGIWFTTGWVVIVDRDGREGISSSMIRPVPIPSLELVLQGVELGHANDQVFGRHNSKQGTGLIGLLTNDVLTREGVFRDAIISALARFLHPDQFEGFESWATANPLSRDTQPS